MDYLEERQAPAGMRQQKAAAGYLAPSVQRLRSGVSSRRRLLFLLLVLGGLTWAIIGQAQLGAYAA